MLLGELIRVEQKIYIDPDNIPAFELKKRELGKCHPNKYI